MVKITGVTADYDETLPVFGVVIIVHLDNTQVLFLSLESKANDPEFAALRGNKRLLSVKTNGNSIYWLDGPRLTLDEIIDMLREDGDKNG